MPEELGDAFRPGLKSAGDGVDFKMVIAITQRNDTQVAGAPDKSARVPGPLLSRAFALGGLVWVLTMGIAVSGQVSSFAFLVLGIATVAAVIVGVKVMRPSIKWPWWTIAGAMCLFLVGAALRSEMHNVGNLTGSRPLLPDIVALTGYLVLATGVLGLSWARAGGRRGQSLDVLLDGLMAMLAVGALLWTFAVEPILEAHRIPLPVRIVIIAYPAMSSFLVVAGFRVAYGPGERQVPSFRYLMAALGFFLVGDTIYMLVEEGLIHASRFINLPYGLALVAVGAGVLNPSMRAGTEAPAGPNPVSQRVRLMVIAIALAVPAVVIFGRSSAPLSDRAIASFLLVALTFVAILRIIQALRSAARSEERLVHQATHDSLTGLPNRRLMHRQLSGALLRGGNVALLFLDVDRFKLVNDTLGHPHGDELLVLLAERLCRNVRPGDVVTRIGGDEFVVVIERTTPEEAREVAERLRRCIRDPFVIDDSEFYLSASVGMAYSGAHEVSRSAETLLRDADTAMYQAKDAGRDTVAVFNGWMQTRMAERLELENNLRHAVERRELSLLYQPIVRLPFGPVEGVEALVRWNHPTYGVLAPTRFVPLAEESGLIGEIGTWVLGEATRQLGMWCNRPSQERMYVAVNLSAAQLYDDQIVEQVSAAISSAGIAPSSLCLELTESVMMDDPARMMGVLSRLRGLGVQLAIDDFGTEYSSLAYLKRFPVQRLKIDRSFIDNIADDDNAEATIVSAMVALAHALGLATIAEGVETPEQAKRVVSLGCDGAQGYLYGRPVKASQLPELASRLRTLPEPSRWPRRRASSLLQKAVDG